MTLIARTRAVGRAIGSSTSVFLRDVGQGLLEVSHNTLALFGLIVMAALIFALGRADVRDTLEQHAFGWLQARKEARTPADASILAGMTELDAVARATAANPKELTRQQASVAQWISRRYRVAPEPISRLVKEAWMLGSRAGLEPTLILAIMAVESSFNPIAESPMGAQGLMQVIPRFHQEKIVDQGSDASLLNPQTNIVVGARVLKEYLVRTGSMQNALQVYNGATNDAVGSMYANKVLAEKQRLEAAAKRRPVPPVQARTRTAAPAVVRSPTQVGPIALAPRLPTLLQETREVATVAEASVAASVHD